MPEEVLREAQEEMMDYRGCGQSVMEMSHRSKVFDDLINETEEDLRDLMQIPDNYRILYMQGGASLQFAMIPMNLMRHGVADYIITGQWAKRHGRKHRSTVLRMRSHPVRTRRLPTFRIAAICRLMRMPITCISCENNTIYGTKYKKLPNTKGKLLVSDVSSCFLSEPVNVSDYGILYGGVQKISGRPAW